MRYAQIHSVASCRIDSVAHKSKRLDTHTTSTATMPSLHCHIPCRCEHCRIVARVQHDVRGVLGDGYTDNEEVRIALARIIDTADAALQVLHRAHRPEQYREEEGDRLPIRPTSQESLPKESLSKKPGSDEASETSTVNPHSGKQMSCDHCRKYQEPMSGVYRRTMLTASATLRLAWA